MSADGGRRRLPRTLHPIAWWVWAIALATAVSRTTNPLLLIVALAVLGLVVANRRVDAPWSRAFRYYLGAALIVVAIRVVFRSVFASGVTPEDHILFRLPQVPLPHWYTGVHLGGPVSLEATLSAATDGLRLGTMLCCIGAANALANPKRALRVLPGALYEAGVAVTVAISVAPQLIDSIQRVRRARRLRPGASKGLRAIASIVIPVLEDALDRSLMLARAMDGRGYGRHGTATAETRRAAGALLLVGLLGLCAGAYGLLDGTAPRTLGAPAVGVGVAASLAGLALGSRRVTRTAYRPDPWLAPEWIVAGAGIVTALLLYVTVGYDAADLNPSYYPLHWPSFPLVPALAILLAALPAVASPPPTGPRPGRPTSAVVGEPSADEARLPVPA